MSAALELEQPTRRHRRRTGQRQGWQIANLRQQITIWEDRLASAQQGVTRAQERVEQARAEVAELRETLKSWEGRG